MAKTDDELLKEGIILLMGKINNNNSKEVVEKILYLNKQEDVKRITLMVNSIGGGTQNAFSIIDMMAMSGKKVDTIGMGDICSAGLMIFMAGKKRKISSNATILSHQYSWGMDGKHHELISVRKEQDLTAKRLLRLYKKCTKKSEHYIRKHLLKESDVWLTPEEAVKHGLADEVINKW